MTQYRPLPTAPRFIADPSRTFGAYRQAPAPPPPPRGAAGSIDAALRTAARGLSGLPWHGLALALGIPLAGVVGVVILLAVLAVAGPMAALGFAVALVAVGFAALLRVTGVISPRRARPRRRR